MGADLSVSLAGMHGQVDLNVFAPVAADELLTSLTLLTNGVRAFTERCVRGIQANESRLAARLARNNALVTALAPTIGYERAAEISKLAVAEGLTVREAAVRFGGTRGRRPGPAARPAPPHRAGGAGRVGWRGFRGRVCRARLSRPSLPLPGARRLATASGESSEEIVADRSWGTHETAGFRPALARRGRPSRLCGPPRSTSLRRVSGPRPRRMGTRSRWWNGVAAGSIARADRPSSLPASPRPGPIESLVVPVRLGGVSCYLEVIRSAQLDPAFWGLVARIAELGLARADAEEHSRLAIAHDQRSEARGHRLEAVVERRASSGDPAPRAQPARAHPQQ